MKDQCGDEMIVQAADLTADPDLNQDPGLLRLQAGNVEDIPGEALVLLDTRRGNFTPVGGGGSGSSNKKNKPDKTKGILLPEVSSMTFWILSC